MEFIWNLGLFIAFVGIVFTIWKAWSEEQKWWAIWTIIFPILWYVYCILNWSEMKIPFSILMVWTFLYIISWIK
jgi:hypothetical protein